MRKAFLFLLPVLLFFGAAYPSVLRRMKSGREDVLGYDLQTPAGRRALAREVAERCGLRLRPPIKADPYLVWGDFLPGGGSELALAAELYSNAGFLALLAPAKNGWRLLSCLGPRELGAPTSVSLLIIPGRVGAALTITDLADQMAGAFCRREDCTILGVRDGEWWRLWQREIESEAYWNRAWDRPPGRGWLCLAGRADWQIKKEKKGCRLLVAYRNSLAMGPAQATLPETHRFTVRWQVRGREEYRWDPELDLFVLGYGRVKSLARLLGPDGRPIEPPVFLPPGRPVAVLADEAATPKALAGRACLLRVWGDGREGFLSPAAVVWPLPRAAGRGPKAPLP